MKQSHPLKKLLGRTQRMILRRIVGGSLSALQRNSDLQTLAIQHPTDKLQHGYLKHYTYHFHAIRSHKLTILEIGIGGLKKPHEGGSSLRMWQAYFPNSMIHGIDIYDKHYHDAKRIKTHIGSQNDPAFLVQLIETIGTPDIIIDDGSHFNEHVITSFNTLFPLLADNGMYVIEDLQTSYWKGFGGTWQDLQGGSTSMNLLKRLTDGLNYQFIPHHEPDYFDRHIVEMHLYSNIAFLMKGNNESKITDGSLIHVRREEADAKLETSEA